MQPGESELTIDHTVIRAWVARRKGRPMLCNDLGCGFEKLLTIGFDDDNPPKRYADTTWEVFFEHFERHDLAFLYQEITSSGEVSHFFKLVRR